MQARDTEHSSRRRRDDLGIVVAMTRLHPRPFTIAVAGAFLFALCTVASSIAVQWAIDHVILPRFDEGGVATSTVLTGCLAIIAIGVLRVVGVVTRRS
ncbi:MAG: hypothetical protein HKN41_02085, partial [Ilumatobacter sp.]|nr:hypothetical protein [Ilumatobacter sp.]